jgi:hypothetical protein
MEKVCSKCGARLRARSGKKRTISRKEWQKVKYGTIFESDKGVRRKNLAQKGSNFVVFRKLRPAFYSHSETYYGYNDLCLTYRIVRY